MPMHGYKLRQWCYQYESGGNFVYRLECEITDRCIRGSEKEILAVREPYRGLSNRLWAAAQPQDAEEVLEIVSDLVAPISLKASKMEPEGLSNSLLAAVKLQDVAPEVLKIVPALTAQIPLKAGQMSTETLCHCVVAAGQLHDLEVWKIVPPLVAQVI